MALRFYVGLLFRMGINGDSVLTTNTKSNALTSYKNKFETTSLYYHKTDLG